MSHGHEQAPAAPAAPLTIIKELVPEEERRAVIADCAKLPFGKFFSDHMFLQKYEKGAWQSGKVTKMTALPMHPAALVLHYAQEIFEGLKCFQRPSDGKLMLFRPDRNIARMNVSAARLCMPQLDPAYFLQALKEVIRADRRHVPSQPGTSLYIRPTMIATEGVLGVRPSSEYFFYIITSTVGPYYPEGFNPTKIFVTREYVRSAPGGTGAIKCGGNYAASLAGAELAHKQGCSQVLWLDGIERKYIEEVGAMNIMFVKDGVVITPPLRGTILPGVTRDTILTLCHDLHIPCEERLITIDEVRDGIKSGAISECFGTGTAASVAPVGEIVYEADRLVINGGLVGPITHRLFDTIVGIQRGELPDAHGWCVPVDE